jgi:hypothetical protein
MSEADRDGAAREVRAVWRAADFEPNDSRREVWNGKWPGEEREQEPKSPLVFTSERGAPFTTAGTRTCSDMPAGTHSLTEGMMRALQAYLGHRNIQHTVRYTELSPTRFKNFWRE